MSDHNDYKNGHDRVPDKRPEIGHDDVENLIDFDNTDDEDNLEVDAEDSEELSEMQVVDEAAQLLEQDDSDEIQEIPGDLPDILYEFDPINEVVGDSSSEEVLEISGDSPQVLHELGLENEVAGAASSEEIQEISGDMPEVFQVFDPENEVAGASSGSNAQKAVEQQIVDLTGVVMEMVEERSENQLNAEEHSELVNDDTVKDKESSPRKSISDEHLNPGYGETDGNDLSGKSTGHSSAEDNLSRVSLAHHANDQYSNLEPSVPGGMLSASGQFDGAVNTRQPGISRDMLEAEINLQGDTSESNHSTQNERLDIGQSGSHQCIGESLNSAGNSSIQSAAPSDDGLVSEQDYDLRDHAEYTSQPVAQEVEHLNGGPGSGPDPGEQQEKVGHLAANEEAVVAQPEAPLDPNGNNPDRIENLIVPDEQDNLLEEQVEEVLIAAVPEPLEPEQRPNEEVVVDERGDAEVQN